MPDLCVSVIGDVTSHRDAEAFGLIVFVLGSVFCFWYHSYYLLLKLQAGQDGIHRPDKSHTHIQPSIWVHQWV